MRQLICGKNSVLDAIKNKLPINVIYTTRSSFLFGDYKVERVSKNFLDQLTTENHQGFVAELTTFNYYDLATIIRDQPQRVLVLDHIQDPHNLGAIIRNANAFGIKHIIIPKKRCARINPTVFRISSGGYVGMKIIQVDSLMATIMKLKQQRFWVYATGFNNSVNFKDVVFNFPLVIVFGSEAKGVSRAILKHADKIISIKTTGMIQSLNVAVATGIILSQL